LEELAELELVIVGLVVVLAGIEDSFAGVVLVFLGLVVVLVGTEDSYAGVVLVLAENEGLLGRLAPAGGASVLVEVENSFHSFAPVGVVLVDLDFECACVVGMGFETADLAFGLEESGLWLESAASWLPVLDRHCSRK